MMLAPRFATIRRNVAYPILSRRVFEEAIKQFRCDSSVQSIILTDAEDRDGRDKEIDGRHAEGEARRRSGKMGNRLDDKADTHV